MLLYFNFRLTTNVAIAKRVVLRKVLSCKMIVLLSMLKRPVGLFVLSKKTRLG
jgi:hypothetical protein